jgi:hypothetical protein
MTSEVMARAQSRHHDGRNEEVFMKLRLFSVLAVLIAFTAYTAVVVAEHGYTGFIQLALTGGWGAQMFIDLCIALVLFLIWMIPDARDRDLPVVPYVVAILTTGSIGALAYLLHRTWRQSRLASASGARPAPAVG